MPGDVSAFIRDLQARRGPVMEAAIKGVTEFAAHVIGDAAEIAPVGGGIYSPRDPAPGTLKAGATWRDAQLEGQVIVAMIGFNAAHAAVQHENLEFRHEPPGQAKYLETAMKQNQPKFAAFMEKRIAPVMNG
jgi:hypothetical protein